MWRALLIAGLSAATAGCSSSAAPACSSSSPPTGLTLPAFFSISEVFDVGGAATVRLSAPEVSCPGAPAVESADAVVVDAHNRPIASTVSFEGGNPGSATVTFQPAESGFHHVTVTFSPVGGRAQRDVFVLQPVTPQAHAHPNGICRSAFRLASGTWVCDQFSGIDPAPFVTFDPSVDVAASARSVWTYATTLRQLAEADGGLAEVRSGPSPSPLVHLLAGDDDAVGVSTGSLIYFRPDGGTFETTEVTHPFADPYGIAGVRIGERVYVAAAQTGTGADFESPAGHAAVCAWDLRPEGIVAVPNGDAGCSIVTGEPFAADQSGIWTYQTANGTLELYTPSAPDGGFSLFESVTFGTDAMPIAAPAFGLGNRPAIDLHTLHAPFIPVRAGDALLFQRYPFDDVGGATESVAWSGSPSAPDYYAP